MRVVLAAGAVSAVLLTAACSGSSHPAPHYRAAPAPRVALTSLQKDVPAALTVGVVVSATSLAGQGADDAGLAAGARVAQYRLGAGAVRLTVLDDHGTTAGALAAVARLEALHVAGIVMATQGNHVDAALRAAAAHQTAVLLPYDGRSVAGATTSWTTGPTDVAVAQRLVDLSQQRGLTTPYVLAGEGGSPLVTGLQAAGRNAAVGGGPGLEATVGRAAAALAGKKADGVVVAAAAATEAAAVGQLEGSNASAPLVLGPSALTPTFASTLDELSADGSATTSGAFLTVGEASTDNAGTAGVVAFLSALRLAAADPSVSALQGTRTFSASGAATADTRSHDAVLVLVQAARTARSTSPSAVLAALGGLHLGEADGLAGPPLDLTTHTALAAADVVALQSTPQDPGQRAGIAQSLSSLTWFALPAS